MLPYVGTLSRRALRLRFPTATPPKFWNLGELVRIHGGPSYVPAKGQ